MKLQILLKKNGIQIDEWIEETISGTLEPQRRQLGPLLDRIQKDDLIICSELSHLGRSADIGTTIMLMQGISVNRIAKLYGVHRNTVKLFIKRKKLDSEKKHSKSGEYM